MPLRSHLRTFIFLVYKMLLLIYVDNYSLFLEYRNCCIFTTTYDVICNLGWNTQDVSISKYHFIGVWKWKVQLCENLLWVWEKLRIAEVMVSTEAQASVCVQRHFLHRDNSCRAFIGCTRTPGICRMLEEINKYEKRDKWEDESGISCPFPICWGVTGLN